MKVGHEQLILQLTVRRHTEEALLEQHVAVPLKSLLGTIRTSFFVMRMGEKYHAGFPYS